MLSPKSPAPAFALASTSGRLVSTKDLAGKRYVLYFYPKDDTPGCTREACDFRDNLARLGAANVRVLGVSKDSVASHEKFRAKYGLKFDLLSDPENRVAKSFGAFGEKLMYGKPVTGVIRSTFLIDAQGLVERVWSPVKVEGHVDAVLTAIAEGRPDGKKAVTLVPPRAPAVKKPAGTKAAAPKARAAKAVTAKTMGAKSKVAKRSTKPARAAAAKKKSNSKRA